MNGHRILGNGTAAPSRLWNQSRTRGIAADKETQRPAIHSTGGFLMVVH
jgi:hypothetical protein